jgi:LacI family transcriptional regulator
MSSAPSALFCTNAIMGIAALRAFQSLSISCPEQMALVTFDELAVDGLFRPGITTVVQPAYEIGYRGASALLQKIKAGARKAAPLVLRLPTELRLRESSMYSNRTAGATQASSVSDRDGHLSFSVT